MPSLLRLVTVCLGAACAAVSPALAQVSVTPPPSPARPAPQGGGATSSVPLVPDPIVLEGLGLSIRPPIDAIVARELSGGNVSLLVAERSKEPRWRVRIQQLSASIDTPTATMVVQDHLNRLNAAKEPFSVLAAEPVRFGGTPGEMLVVQQRGRDGQPVVNGWLVLPRGGLTFTVATMATTPTDLPAARAALEAMLGTIELADLDQLIARRADRLEAGERVVSSFTPEVLRRLVGFDEWYRMYRPAAADGRDAGSATGSNSNVGRGRDSAGGSSGDREVGYIQFRVVEAMRGELDPSRRIDTLRGEEAERGLMLIARSRGLLSDDGARTLDVEARYWMAWDRSSEAWSSRSTEREGKSVRAFAQTGVRSPASLGQPSVLTVVNVRAGAAPDPDDKPKEWVVPGRAYLCMPEVLLLGNLLAATQPRDSAPPKELSFFWFDTKGARMPQRLDRWRPEGDGWILTTQPALDEPIITQTFDSSGHRVRRSDADGVVTERIDPGALLALWKSKGLSTRDDQPRSDDRGSRDRNLRLPGGPTKGPAGDAPRRPASGGSR
ncbi:MAG: hypothetical protein U0575_13640 [Phycisphaerales bacterium]